MNKKIKSYVTRTEARANLPQLIDYVMDGYGPITISQKGKEQAVIISAEEYKKIKKRPIKFSETGLVGMWKDREDMKDSVTWVNKIRKEEERDARNYSTPDK